MAGMTLRASSHPCVVSVQGVIVGARFMRQCVHEFMTTKRFPLNRGAGLALCVLEAYQGLAISLTATVSKLKDWAGTNARRVLVTEVGAYEGSPQCLDDPSEPPADVPPQDLGTDTEIEVRVYLHYCTILYQLMSLNWW